MNERCGTVRRWIVMVAVISPRRMKMGYYEFEGEDKYPEEEETPVKSKRLKLKYKPRDFKEALLLKPLEEGQLIRQITDAELSSQDILRNDSEMPVIQQQGVDLKEHFDRIEERFNMSWQRQNGIKTSIYNSFNACCGIGEVLFDLIGGLGEVKLDVMPVSAGAFENISMMLLILQMGGSRSSDRRGWGSESTEKNKILT
jgi:hypothetical protein